MKNILSPLFDAVKQTLQTLRQKGPDQLQFWIIALIVGILAAVAALIFRVAVEAGQAFFYQTDNVLHTQIPWYFILLIPTIGGLIVGWILTRFTPDGRVRAVADVIEGAALNDGRVEHKAGLASALASFVTLSMGGSTGREGPVVHLAGWISTKIADGIKANGVTGRELLGCAVAAAVAVSFNAPIAGALFALEVVLRHFALHAFAPIVIASVAGAVIGRLALGAGTEFVLVSMTSREFYLELPAFMLLGLVCGFVSVVVMRSVFMAEDIAENVQDRWSIPAIVRPAIAGLMLGAIAIWFPHIIGVGTDLTALALTNGLALHTVLIFLVIKIVAVTITVAGRMGGGIFSPALMIGALTGLGFGIVATSVFPDASGAPTLYALAGMGAVAAAVLGAPISTTLIVFELTGDWRAGLAVMVAVSLSSAVASGLVTRSFFLTQLARRNVRIAAGPQAYLLSTLNVTSILVADHSKENDVWALVEKGQYVDVKATLEGAVHVFETSNVPWLPVISVSGETKRPKVLGIIYYVDALKQFNTLLAARSAEEHA